MSIPQTLVPIEISDAMLISSDIVEPAASETEWVPSGTYVAGDQRIRTSNHRKYICIQGHTGVTTAPEEDPVNWTDIGPTLKWAMFDNACSTQSTATDTFTVVLQVGFFNALSFYNLSGNTLSVVIKDEPAGTEIYNEVHSLVGPFIDEYDWHWGPYREKTKLTITDILPYPDAEITVTITGSTGETVGIGMMAVGNLQTLMLTGRGGVQYGATVEPVDFSYVKINDFGDTTIVKRRNATDLKISVVMDQEDADYCLSAIQAVLSIPVAWVISNDEGYSGLNVFGLGSGSIMYAGPTHAVLSLRVKGLV